MIFYASRPLGIQFQTSIFPLFLLEFEFPQL